MEPNTVWNRDSTAPLVWASYKATNKSISSPRIQGRKNARQIAKIQQTSQQILNKQELKTLKERQKETLHKNNMTPKKSNSRARTPGNNLDYGV